MVARPSRLGLNSPPRCSQGWQARQRRSSGSPVISRTAGRWSQHAVGQAIDIAGFRLSDGTTVSVDRDWNEPGAKGQFLRQLARKACRYFSVVLTPDSNAEHYNHLHLDIGPDRLCST